LKIYDIVNVELLNGVAEEIPLPDNSIDLIVSNNGLNNVQDLEKSFSECRRIAKKGCQFIATMNLDKTMNEFYSVFKEVVMEMNMQEIVDSIDQHIYEKRKPVEELINMFEKNKFRTKYQTHSFRYRFADGTSMFNYFLIRVAFVNSWMQLTPLEKTNKIFLEIEKRLNDIAASENGISLSIPYIVIDSEFAG
jgi:ubiquinone/menaquinone biosynthesis C-methylase UbiE